MKKTTPPGHLSPASKKLWRAILDDYEIDPAAELILEATLTAKDRHEQARAAIAKDGAVVKDRFGQLKVNPWVAVERDAAGIMMRGFVRLGFDQETRGELGTPRRS
jgi:P27 family predicted phage terminase small subunit